MSSACSDNFAQRKWAAPKQTQTKKQTVCCILERSSMGTPLDKLDNLLLGTMLAVGDRFVRIQPLRFGDIAGASITLPERWVYAAMHQLNRLLDGFIVHSQYLAVHRTRFISVLHSIDPTSKWTHPVTFSSLSQLETVTSQFLTTPERFMYYRANELFYTTCNKLRELVPFLRTDDFRHLINL